MAVALPAAGCRTSRGRWLSRTDPSNYPARYGAPLIAVHRADLQRALLERLTPGTVRTGSQVQHVEHVEHVEQHPDEVLVRHSQGVARAELVVLTDGLTARRVLWSLGRHPDRASPATPPGAA